ncbi:MAG: choice-of-anchor Q domain-containing protein [Dokdonella sp.]
MRLYCASLLFVFVNLASVPCHADPVCVSSEAELRQALLDAGANLTDEIRLMEGTYFTGGQKFSYDATDAHTLSISGGWYDDHDPCDFQHPRADGTILDGQNVTAVLSINNLGDGPGTTLAVSNLTLRNGATSTNGESAALALFGGLHQDLRVRNVIVLSSHNTAPPPHNIFTNVVTLNSFADVYFINNVIGDSTSNYANLAIFAEYPTQTVFMHNNTLSLNGAGFGALLDSSGGTAFRLVNNAIKGDMDFNSRNSGDPIRLWLYSNLGWWSYSSIVTAPLVQADVGNDPGIDPGFLGALDFRPAAGSPLVNRGLNAPFGGSSSVDLDGNPRVDLGVIDVGAFESTRERIFANGFE